ncbi:MAG: hypothetical protein IJS45_07760 [Clostridia bacterium]|nr:hypothetical protein [Clostridia bacterium]
MKTIKRIFAIVMAFAFAVSMAVTAFAATQVEQGKTVIVSFTIPESYSADGNFTFSNRDLFTVVNYNWSTALGGSISNDRLFFYSLDGTAASVTINVTVTVKAGASAGDSCDITMNYETSDEAGDMSDWKSMTQTIVVKEAEVTTPVTQPVTETKAPDTEPTPVSDTDEPIDRTDIDYTELLRQISVAQGLVESEYTIDSWDAMQEQLRAATALKTSKKQGEVDAGARALEQAIAALVKLDYSKLKKAYETAKGLENCAHGPLWFKLFESLGKVDEMLKSRDQDDINALTKEIEDIIEEIKKDCPDCGKENVKEIIKEVEKLPEGDYCNITSHKVWPILFFISLAINLVLGGLIAWFFLKRKQNQKDDTPLVDYDIGDDE